MSRSLKFLALFALTLCSLCLLLLSVGLFCCFLLCSGFLWFPVAAIAAALSFKVTRLQAGCLLCWLICLVDRFVDWHVACFLIALLLGLLVC